MKYYKVVLIVALILILLCGCGARISTEEKIAANKLIYDGIMRNDYEMVESGISKGADLDHLDFRAINSRYDNAVAIAIFEAQNTDMVSFLIENGADGDVVIEKGFTVLMFCAINNLYEPTKALIEAGVDIDKRDLINRRSALNYVMAEIPYENEALRMCELFLENGAEVTEKTFYCALREGFHFNGIDDAQTISTHYEKMRMIFNELSDTADIELHPALKYAIEGDWNKMFKALESNISDGELKLLALFTAAFGETDVIRTLFEDYNVDTNTHDWQNNNLAVVAATYDNVNMLDYLISVGVDVSEENYEIDRQRICYNDALILATRNKSYNTIEYILKNKYLTPVHSINDSRGRMPSPVIEEIASNCNVLAVKVFEKHGFILNEADKEFLLSESEDYAGIFGLTDEFEQLVDYVEKQ